MEGGREEGGERDGGREGGGRGEEWREGGRERDREGKKHMIHSHKREHHSSIYLHQSHWLCRRVCEGWRWGWGG